MIIGLKYVSGPLTVGATVEKAWLQGTVALTGVTQRYEQGIAAGANYVVAPGFTVFGEYMYEEIYQGANNFVTGVVGTSASAIGRSLATTRPRRRASCSATSSTSKSRSATGKGGGEQSSPFCFLGSQGSSFDCSCADDFMLL